MSERDENIHETTAVPETSQISCPPGGILYTVRAGDTLFSIANRFGISVECLRRFNPQVSGDQIFPGQVLCVPPASACVPTQHLVHQGDSYTVRGDTLFSIANRFGSRSNAYAVSTRKSPVIRSSQARSCVSHRLPLCPNTTIPQCPPGYSLHCPRWRYPLQHC